MSRKGLFAKHQNVTNKVMSLFILELILIFLAVQTGIMKSYATVLDHYAQYFKMGCRHLDANAAYDSLYVAKQACDKDRECTSIENGNCGGKYFYKCLGIGKKFAATSCVYVSGNIPIPYFYIMDFLLI